MSDLLSSVLSNVWTLALAVLLLGLSIFIHELGHFLAARRRGVKVERFSIGFGPAIWSRRGNDGVEYRVSWIPLGGYVLLPQIADLGAIEGDSPSDGSRSPDLISSDVAKLPALTYGTKLIVLVAGATFNVLLAFALACVLWVIGLPESNVTSSTRIGYIAPTLDLSDGTTVPSPALEAGLQVGDIVQAIDGHTVKDWNEVKASLMLGDGRSASGERQVIFMVERQGRPMQIALQPRIAGEQKERRVGIAPGYELIVHGVTAGSVGQHAGFQRNDEILRLDETPVLNEATYREYLDSTIARSVVAHVRRNGAETTLTIPATPSAKAGTRLGLDLTTGFRLTHPSPFTLLADQAKMVFRSIWSLISPHSDVGLAQTSGVIGIIRIFQSAAEAGIRAVLIITIMVNVNLAIFNLLPIPVLDGGQILFATIARLRGRALPTNFVITAQSVCFALLISLIIYVGFFDARRLARDVSANRTESQLGPAPAAPAAKP
ncbi:MAG: RIP metalloprotease RseP [Opitutaceae bacterium]